MLLSGENGKARLIDPVERISEILFGLFMAVTIVGSISIAESGNGDVRTALAAALGCNLAWGLVDAFMHLVRTRTERVRVRTLAIRVQAADAESGRQQVREELPSHIRAIVVADDIEAMRHRLAASPLPEATGLRRDDVVAAIGIFLLVVTATFPVVLPFLLTDDLALAMRLSRWIALAMLFAAGLALGRHAGHPHPLRTGVSMALLGALLILAVMALGG